MSLENPTPDELRRLIHLLDEEGKPKPRQRTCITCGEPSADVLGLYCKQDDPFTGLSVRWGPG